MIAFRDGTRGNNPGMSDLMKADLAGRHRRHLAVSRGPADTRRQQRPLTLNALLGGEARAQRLVGGKIAGGLSAACRAALCRRRG